MNWDDTKILLAIGRTGGLSRTAKALGVSVSTVHRRAAQLEHALKATLFSRRSDGYTLTEAGQRFFALAEQAEEHLTAMERQDFQGQQDVFRIAAPELVGPGHNNKEDERAMKFIHLTDIHLVAPGAPLNGGVPSDRLTACLDDISRWHGDAEFCVISGDLAEFAEPEAYAHLRNTLAGFPLPCFLMIGNHDDRAVFLSEFPDHPRDENGFIQHRHDCDAGVFLFLDTTVDGADQHQGLLCDQRLDWLRQNLQQAGERPVYLFMHHPPFDIGIDYLDPIRLLNDGAFHEVLQTAGNLRHVFYGHVHRMTYVNWRGIPFTSLPSLNHQVPLIPESVAGEFCDEPPAYGVVELSTDQMTVHFNTFLQRNPLHQT